MGYGNRPITKENILRTINEYDILKYYCIPFKKIGEAFCSELRKDRRPTCYIFEHNNRLLYKDFGSKDALDCFSYVQKKYSLTFLECLRVIVNDFRLNLGYEDNKTLPTLLTIGQHFTGIDVNQFKRKPTVVKVTIRKWNNIDKEYWNSNYGLSVKDLYNIYPLERFWMNDSCIQAQKACYGYYFGLNSNSIHQWKIYQPYLSKEGKWFSNCEKGHLQGYDLLNWFDEKLIITKSYKDVLILKKMGYNAVAPHGEGHHIEPEIINNLKKKFNSIVIIYDNDEPGIEASTALSQTHGLYNIILPEFDGKDIADYVKNKGYTETRRLLEGYYTQMAE